MRAKSGYMSDNDLISYLTVTNVVSTATKKHFNLQTRVRES